MAAIIRAYKEYWDEMLAVGVGVVATDVAGNTVKGFVGPWLDKIGLTAWADPITEALIGTGLLAVSEMFLKGSSKVYGRLAAFGATAVAVADVVAVAMGMVPAPAPARPTPVRRPVPARPVAPRVAPRPAPRPAAVTVIPRPAAPTPKPAAPKTTAKIFGS